MRLLSRLEYERLFGASWVTYFVRIPYQIFNVAEFTYSHPFVERLIDTLRREFLDHVIFWNSGELKRTLDEFRVYYNHHRVHAPLGGDTLRETSGEAIISRAGLHQFRWQLHCRGPFQLPLSA
jgi:hypothetical protein